MKKKSKKQKKTFLRKLVITLVILLVLFIVSCFLSGTEEERIQGDIEVIPGLELPVPLQGEQIVKHTGYTLSYNEQYEQPSYVAYELNRNEVLGTYERADNFRPDKSVKTGSATLEDYKGSGFDRGHLAPAADFKWSEQAMDDTFYMSNMSPQEGSFNRGIWADLEAMVRVNAFYDEILYVVTGPVLTDGPYETIGENEVAVPNYYYKVLLDYTEPEKKAIGFILPNGKSTKKMEYYATSVDEVERITGIDFYPMLPDEIEAELEGSFDSSLWNFSTSLPKNSSEMDFEEINYVKSDKDRLLDLISEYLYDLKKLVFDYTGTTDIARQFNLI